MFGKKKTREQESDLVRIVDVSLMMNKVDGSRCVDLDGEFVDGDTFHLIMSEKLAKEMADLIYDFIQRKPTP